MIDCVSQGEGSARKCDDSFAPIRGINNSAHILAMSITAAVVKAR